MDYRKFASNTSPQSNEPCLKRKWPTCDCNQVNMDPHEQTEEPMDWEPDRSWFFDE